MTTPGERFLEDNADGYGVQDYGAAADALVTAGVVSADRAAYWKAEHARGQAALTDAHRPCDPETEVRSIELLQALFAAVRPRSGEDWDPVAYQRYQEALSTLHAIGALSIEHMRPWMERQQEALTPAGGWPEPEPEPQMPFSAGDLSAVLPGPLERLGGMRVMHMELYGDCVIVYFHQVLPPEPADPVERRELLEAPFELHDDRGTAYRPAAIPAGGGCAPDDKKPWREVFVGWQAFVPAAPLEANELTATWREEHFVMSVRGK